MHSDGAYHLCQSTGSDNISRVHQAVQVSCALLDCLPHLIVAIKVEDIGDEVERILVVLYLRIESGEVEAVGQVVLVNLAEVLIAAR